jgi:hypothetical protein
MALKNIRGRRGIVTIPALGAVVARIDAQDGGEWEVSRRDDDRKEGEPPTYRLRALFTYLNRGLLEMISKDPRYETEFIVWLTKDKRFRVDWPDRRGMALSGRTLMIERGVTLESLDD